MKKIKIQTLIVASFAFVTLFSLNATAQIKSDMFVSQASTLPKGDKAPSIYFTGNVWVYPLATDTLAHWSVAKVTFESGARSNWHFHPDKQVLVITEGTGYLKEKGKPIQSLHKGDVVTIQPGVEHWHGATPDKEFVQIVINPNIEKGVVTWLKKVTDEEYRSGK